LPFGASTSLLYLSIYIVCSTPTRKPQMSIIPNAMSYLLPTYREVLLSNIYHLHSRSAAIIHNLSKFKKQIVVVGMDLAASKNWSRRGSRIVVLP